MDKLAIVMPVKNEAEIIGIVLEQWIKKFNELNIDYNFFIYNNESEDKTYEILNEFAKNNKRINIINRKNEGHGPAILEGYKTCSKNFDWIFQIDSDNEMNADNFNALWSKRFEYDFLIAFRYKRTQTLTRKIVSFLSRLTVMFFYGKGPVDVNCPYRLMKSKRFINIFNSLSEKTLSPNIILSGVVSKRKLKFYEYPILCLPRKTGRSSLQKVNLIQTIIKSFVQAMIFSFKLK